MEVTKITVKHLLILLGINILAGVISSYIVYKMTAPKATDPTTTPPPAGKPTVTPPAPITTAPVSEGQ